MRYAVVAAGLLASCICWTDVSRAQEACVRAPNGAIVCGPIVQPNFEQPNYGPPTRPNYVPRLNSPRAQSRYGLRVGGVPPLT